MRSEHIEGSSQKTLLEKEKENCTGFCNLKALSRYVSHNIVYLYVFIYT